MSEPFSIAAAAHDAGDAPALIDGQRAYTYRDIANLVVARLAALGRGLREDAPFPVVGEPALDTVVTLYALLERHIPALLLHPRLTRVEREELLGVAARSGPLPGPDPAVVIHTSGTSGMPRAAVLSRGALLASAQASEANLGWQGQDCWLMCMPLAHVGGFSILTRSLAARRCVALHPRFDAERFPRWVSEECVTLASLVPTMLNRVLDADPEWRPPRTLRAILLGGAAASPRLLDRAAAAGVPLVVTYGLTEACSQVTATRYASRFAPAGEGAGAPLPGIELRLVDGRIHVRGPMLMNGYWNAPPLAADAWFDTGDVGMLDKFGNLSVHARRTDLIVTGGENVYPGEVEAVLEACPGIAAAGVFGVPHEVWGQTIVAALVAEAVAPSDGELRDWIDARLAPYKKPRAICYVEQLPHTRGGKLDRRALGEFAGALRPLAA